MGFLGNLFGPKSKATPVHVDDSNFRAEQPTPLPATARGNEKKQISKKALKKQQEKARQKSRAAK